MFKREDIRYHALWVRLVFCLAVAVGLAHAIRANMFDMLEYVLRQYLLYGESEYFRSLTKRAEIAITVGLCVAPALPRFERPVVMLTFVSGLLVAYVAAVFTFLLTWEIMLPSVAPVLGLVGSASLLGTLGWSEERARRRRLESLEHAREQFVDMLVHDLKKRLASILMSLSVLEKKVVPAACEASALLGNLRAAADRMLILVNNLLDIRRTQVRRMPLRRERMPLRGVVEESLREHQPAADLAGVTFSLRDGDDVTVSGDRQVLLRILANLLWNAIQHAPQGSEIEIGCSAEEGKAAIVHVANRGATIPPDRRKSLLASCLGGRPAADGSTATTGLGLAFCKLAVEAHGGDIEIQSPWHPHGDGVKVILRLPAAP